ncbi:MAG TPA: nitroreductase family deazaflavin-dependent oxidoreductase [Rubrobacter sp.]|nr:nitroreductase family deazaflavin-dependent oxidoreductase [Rubrobacter sp.]
MRPRKLYNPIAVAILRSPLHGLMSNSVMLLTYRGRRSGRAFTTPISYVRDGEDLLAVASRDHAWWRNLRGGAPVRVRLRGRELRGTGRLLEGRAGEEGLLRVLRAVPAYRKHWGVQLNGNGRPTDPDAIARIARENAPVRFGDLTEASSR